MYVEAAAHGQAKGPQIVDAVRVVGVGMAQKDAVEPLDPASISCSRKSGEASTRTVVAPLETRSVRQAPSSGGDGSSGSPDRRRPTLPRPAARRRMKPQPRMVRRSVNATIRQPAAACRSLRQLADGKRQPAKDCVGVGARRLGQRFRRDSARLGDHARRGDHEGRLVPAAAMGRRREIGRVGLDQNAVKRDIARNGAQVLRLLERHHAGKRDREPEA